MPKSLNPNAAGNPPPSPAADSQAPATAPRRSVLAGIAAVVVGAIVSLFPLGAGALLFLDPILKRKPKRAGAASADSSGQDERPFRRVAALDALPADGTPVQVPVIADLTDAWNREPNQPVGAVYLRKAAAGVECFNAICPHAGCFVAYSADRKLFQCPCHTSSFQLDGTRILPSPSPRDMDALAVDEARLAGGEVWVQFVNYYPGHEEREAKP